MSPDQVAEPVQRGRSDGLEAGIRRGLEVTACEARDLSEEGTAEGVVLEQAVPARSPDDAAAAAAGERLGPDPGGRDRAAAGLEAGDRGSVRRAAATADRGIRVEDNAGRQQPEPRDTAGPDSMSSSISSVSI